MIVAETDGGFQFVTQPAHARLAGQFADRWGNERFDRPDPLVPTLIAAYEHDTGWQGYDRRPHLDGGGRPVDFREMPAETWIDLYETGIEAVVDLDRYAGLLVSMHGAGLRNRRYGLSPSWPETPAAFEAFVDREEDRQSRLLAAIREEGQGGVSETDAELLAALHGSGSPPEATESRLWTNYRRLQAWDTLSLAFCVTDSPPGYTEISGVPAGDGEDATLSVEALGDGAFAVDPYPFEVSPLTVTVPVRTVERAQFESDWDLVRAYYRAPSEMQSLTVRRSAGE
jgi:hypothetical protein